MLSPTNLTALLVVCNPFNLLLVALSGLCWGWWSSQHSPQLHLFTPERGPLSIVMDFALWLAGVEVSFQIATGVGAGLWNALFYVQATSDTTAITHLAYIVLALEHCTTLAFSMWMTRRAVL